MADQLEKIYRIHHSSKRRESFAVLEEERGNLFKKLIGENKKILDLGCRNGVITEYFVKNNNVTGVDVDSMALDHARQKLGINIAHFDIQGDWPLAGEKFDIIVAAEILEHIFFPENVIEKCSKFLKTDGLFIGSIPNAFSLKNRLKYLLGSKKGTPLEDPMHINHFSWDEFKSMLNKYFTKIDLIPMGRNYRMLRRLLPKYFAYSICFIAENVIN